MKATPPTIQLKAAITYAKINFKMSIKVFKQKKGAELSFSSPITTTGYILVREDITTTKIGSKITNIDSLKISLVLIDNVFNICLCNSILTIWRTFHSYKEGLRTDVLVLIPLWVNV
jgi:hypothetical protein